MEYVNIQPRSWLVLSSQRMGTAVCVGCREGVTDILQLVGV